MIAQIYHNFNQFAVFMLSNMAVVQMKQHYASLVLIIIIILIIQQFVRQDNMSVDTKGYLTDKNGNFIRNSLTDTKGYMIV